MKQVLLLILFCTAAAGAQLKCGKYQHVEHWTGFCASMCSAIPPDTCVDDMHEVTEHEWQDLTQRVKQLELNEGVWKVGTTTTLDGAVSSTGVSPGALTLDPSPKSCEYWGAHRVDDKCAMDIVFYPPTPHLSCSHIVKDDEGMKVTCTWDAPKEQK